MVRRIIELWRAFRGRNTINNLQIELAAVGLEVACLQDEIRDINRVNNEYIIAVNSINRLVNRGDINKYTLIENTNAISKLDGHTETISKLKCFLLDLVKVIHANSDDTAYCELLSKHNILIRALEDAKASNCKMIKDHGIAIKRINTRCSSDTKELQQVIDHMNIRHKHDIADLAKKLGDSILEADKYKTKYLELRDKKSAPKGVIADSLLEYDKKQKAKHKITPAVITKKTNTNPIRLRSGLTAEQIAEICARSGSGKKEDSTRSLAADFIVSKSTILRILNDNKDPEATDLL